MFSPSTVSKVAPHVRGFATQKYMSNLKNIVVVDGTYVLQPFFSIAPVASVSSGFSSPPLQQAGTTHCFLPAQPEVVKPHPSYPLLSARIIVPSLLVSATFSIP